MHSVNKLVLRIVVIVHITVLCVFLFWGCVVRWVTPKPPLAFPVDFIVDVTPPAPESGAEAIPPPEPEPEPEPDPEPIPELTPDPPKPPKPPEPPKPPKPPKPAFERSTVKVIRQADKPPGKKPTLTEEEIRRLLAAGATAGDHNSIPDEDSRNLALIKTTLDTLWQKPSKVAAGNAEAFLRLWIEPDGRVSKAELSRRSGNPALDDSVEAVGRQTQRLHGLTPDFIRRRSPVTIAFTVQ